MSRLLAVFGAHCRAHSLQCVLTLMDNVISEYQKWKQHGESLRTQAKQAMETTFRDLLLQAARIAQEYHTDFGATLKPPPSITAFRYKAGAKTGKKAKTPAITKAVVAKATDP